MALQFETRSSESPWIASVWTCRSDRIQDMTSVASETWGLVFWEQRGTAYACVTGPETKAGVAPVPEDATFVGIQFSVGTSLRSVATPTLVDGGMVLPDSTPKRFWLGGYRERPDADDAEALVARLVGDDTVVRDPLIAEVLRGRRPQASGRTLERRFRTATGLTHGAVAQIERARRAARSLAAGEEVGDVVAGLGYYDEPHLARALRRYVGRTAGQLRRGSDDAIALDLPQPQRTTS